MKKIISLLLCIVIMCGMITVTAANNLDRAQKYILGNTVKGVILEEDEGSTYTFQVANPAKLDIELSANVYNLNMKLYDETGKEIWGTRPYWNDTTEEITFQQDLFVNKGKYFFSVTKGSGEGYFEFVINETATYESFPEVQGGSNNSTKTASPIVHGAEYIGFISMDDNVDVYQMELPSSGKLALSLSANIYSMDLKLYDETGKEIWETRPYWNDTTEEISFQNDVFVNKGKYFFSVSKAGGEGEFAYKFVFTSANESFSEEQGGSNNKTNVASTITINQKYNGFIGLNDNIDIYKITLDGSAVSLNLAANIYSLQLKIFDGTGKEVWSNRPYWNSTIEQINYSEDLELAAGLYYLSVSEASGRGAFTVWFTDGGYVYEPKAPEVIISVLVNGYKVAFDQPPILENGRTLVPLRAIFEALGAEVLWDGNTQTVTASKGGTQISLQIGSTQMYVNGGVITLDVPAKLLNSRTLVPVRAISEAFGCKVDWVQDTQTVVITQ